MLGFHRKSEYRLWLIPYLEGSLDTKRKALLESALASDPALAAELTAMRNTTSHLRESAAAAEAPTADLWPRIQARLQQDARQKQRPPTLVWAGGLCGAAALALVLFVHHPAQPGDTPGKKIQVADRRTEPAIPIAPAPEPGAIPNQRQEPDAVRSRPKQAALSQKPLARRTDQPTARTPEKDHAAIVPLPASAPPVQIASNNAVNPESHSDDLPELSIRKDLPNFAHGAPMDKPLARVKSRSLTDSLVLHSPAVGGGSAFGPTKAIAERPNGKAPAPPAAITKPPLTLSPANAPPGFVGTAGQGFAGGGFGGSAGASAGNFLSESAPQFQGQNQIAVWKEQLLAAARPPLYGDAAGDKQQQEALDHAKTTGQLKPLQHALENRERQKSEHSPQQNTNGILQIDIADTLAADRALGIIYRSEGLLPQSLAQWKQITTSQNAIAEDWFQYGEAARESGNLANARQAYRQALGFHANPLSDIHRAAAQKYLQP